MNVSYVVHDQFGNILRSGMCTDRSVPLQCNGPRASGVLLGEGRDDTHCVWNGEVMLKGAATALGWTGHP